MEKYVNCVWRVTVMRPLQFKKKRTLFASLKKPKHKTTKTLRLKLSQLPEGRPLDSYPLKRRDKY